MGKGTTTYTTGTPTFTAPATLLTPAGNSTTSTGVKVDVRGGKGATGTASAGTNGVGGNGGRVQGVISLAPAGTIKIRPQYKTGGTVPYSTGAIGGKAAAVLGSSTTVLVVGAGGGGGGNGGPLGAGGAGGAGGGGTVGGAGGAGAGARNGNGGAGATAATGGAGGTGSGGAGGTGSSSGTGGSGGTPIGGETGGGGGGGRAGGGGGGGGNLSGTHPGAGGGGGGGSSYAAATVSGPIYTNGYWTGSAEVIVTWAYATKPLKPTLTSPLNASIEMHTSTPVFKFTYQPGATSGSLSHWAMRRKISGTATYSYYNAAAGTWTTGIVWNATTVSGFALTSGTPGTGPCVYTYTFATGKWVDGNVYNYSFATSESHYPTINKGTFQTNATVTAVTKPTVVISSPTSASTVNTQVVSAAWTTTPSAGHVQSAYRLRLFTQAEYSAGGFTPATSTGSYDSGKVTSTATTKTINAITQSPAVVSGTYRMYLMVWETGGTGGIASTWTYVAFTVALQGPPIPVLSVTNGTTATATGLPYNLLAVAVAYNVFSYTVGSLGANPFSVITGTGSFTKISAWTPTHTATTVTTINAYRVKYTSTGTVKFGTATGTSALPLAALVNAGRASPIPAKFTEVFKASVGIASFKITLSWYNAAGTSIGTSTHTTTLTTASKLVTFTVTIPITARTVGVSYTWSNGAATRTVSFERFGLMVGTLTRPWAGGGFYAASTSEVQIQYTDNTGVTWTTVGYTGNVGVLFAGSTYAVKVPTTKDFTSIPGTARKYRARTIGYSSAFAVNLVSAWSATVTAAALSTSGKVFLFNPKNPSGAVAGYVDGTWQPTVHEVATRTYPIGRKYGIKSTDGTKGIGGTMPFRTATPAALTKLLALMETIGVLCLTMPKRRYYVTLTGDRKGKVLGSTLTGPQGFTDATITVPYVQVARP